MKRTATANWKGTGKEGKGVLSNQSGILNNARYSSGSRFEEDMGTNPEELIAAAHAGCFSMKFAYILNAAGFTPDNIDTKCTMTIESGTITSSHLEMKASVPDIDQTKFNECSDEAKRTCPVSKALNMDITLEAELVSWIVVPEEDSSQYIPGACNIGKEEIRRRYRIGFTGLVFALLMVFIIHATNADRLWRLGVLIPVFYSASGFIQAMNKFCYVYGFRHVFSVQGKRNFTTVSDEERIKKDREKSLQIVLFVTISSMSITAAYYFFN